jgi:hypothetical protein
MRRMRKWLAAGALASLASFAMVRTLQAESRPDWRGPGDRAQCARLDEERDVQRETVKQIEREIVRQRARDRAKGLSSSHAVVKLKRRLAIARSQVQVTEQQYAQRCELKPPQTASWSDHG